MRAVATFGSPGEAYRYREYAILVRRGVNLLDGLSEPIGNRLTVCGNLSAYGRFTGSLAAGP